jgi:hypothetical protein
VTDNDKKLYLRVLANVSFMLEIIHRCDEQADSFASEMLHQRIVLERETIRLEEDRLQREVAERIANHQEDLERKTVD